MSNQIPQAAIDAAAKSLTEITPNLYQDPHNPDRYFGGLAERALEAAMPIIWAQIDVDELAEVIADHDSLGYVADTGVECECGELVAGPDDDRPYHNWRLHTARAVKAWLTGKDKK